LFVCLLLLLFLESAFSPRVTRVGRGVCGIARLRQRRVGPPRGTLGCAGTAQDTLER
jgi:hypothetical protein